MINLCTCTGGSTSSIRSSKRRGGTTLSCKNCGGKPTIDGKSSSTCLLSTVLELTSLINSDITWTKISKGCRSSSRRPRTSNTITDLRGLEMPVSESEKLGVSVLGCHFSEKAEHIPIKKRRFLFRASSPPQNNLDSSLEGHAISPKISTCLPVISEEVTGTCERGSNDGKLDGKVLMKEDDFSGISILAAAACINSLGAEADHCEGSEIVSSVTKGAEVPKTVEISENNEKDEKLDCHISTGASGAASSTLDNSLESAVIKTNQEPSIEKSPARDVKFDWDLNTVMDAWEEPFVSENDAANANVKSVEEIKNDYTKGDFELNSERESGSTSKGVSNQNLPVEFKSLPLEDEKLEMGNHKPEGYAEIHEPLSHGSDGGQHTMVMITESMHDKHIDSPNNVIPVTRTLSVESPTHGIFSKWPVQRCQRSGGFGSTEAVNTQLTMDRSVPPGFGQCLNMHASKENSVVGNNVNFPATTEQAIMSKHELSLTTATFLENGGHQSPTPKAEDEHRMKMELAGNVVGMSDVVTKGTEFVQDPVKGGNKVVNQAMFGESSVAHSSVLAENQPAATISFHEAAHSNAEVALDNCVGYRNSLSENRAGNGIDKLDEVSVGYDSQYEDGELRDSHLHAWKRYEENEGGHESDMDTREDNFNFGTAHETSSQFVHEDSSRIKLNDGGFGREADLTSRVMLPEKLHSSDEVVSGSGPNEIISGQENNERGDNVQHTHQSDVWRMNVSGWDIMPENQRISSDNFSRTRNFTARKFSYGEQKDGFDTEDVEMKGEGSRFYRRESLTRIGGPSTFDTFLSSRGRFRLQGCSSKVNDGFTSRSERESGQLRPFGRGRYSPHRPSGRGGGMWNRSPERDRDLKRLPSPSYRGQSFSRSMLDDAGSVDDMANECGMDTSDTGRPNTSSYVTRRVYRSRSPGNREANDFRARLGLRPTGDTGHERFVNVGRGRGRGRSVRYGTGTRLEGEGPRGRYHGPASDDCDEYITEYIPRRRRCISPIERRVNQSYPHHQSGSRSPPSRPRTRSPIANSGFRRRSRSPNFRPDTRIRRLRSPNYRDHALEYNTGPRNNNSSPPSSRWVNYKERVFDRRSPPPGRTDAPQGERFRFYDSVRKPKQNEYYRSGHPGRFSDINEGGRGRPRYVNNDGDRPNNTGYRRGGFVKRYNMDGPTKRFYHDNEDGFGRGLDDRDKQALELHARSTLNPKPCSNGTDSRFRDYPRRTREDSDVKRRSKEEKDPSVIERDSKEESEHMGDDSQRRPKEVKEQSTTNIDSMPNEVVKEDDKPTLGY